MTSVAPTAPQDQAVCPNHPMKTAVGTCERCGRYVCADCRGTEDLCPECLRQRLDALPSSAARAKVAAGFFVLTVVTEAMALLIGLWAITSPGESGLRQGIEVVNGFMALAAAFGTIITYLRWLHLTVRQMNALGVDVGATPGWAVGYWFVPFANLVKPYHTVRNIVSGLGGERLVASLGIGWWWAAWLIAGALENIEGRIMLREGLFAPTSPEVYAIGIGTSLLNIAGALLCLRIILAVQRHMAARRGE
jgi:Domain of unknown function (DUF4328)